MLQLEKNALKNGKLSKRGSDILCKVKSEKYQKPLMMHESNKHAAFTTTLKYCSQTMKNRTEEASNNEMDINNDPFELLKEIKIKMCGQVRAKYKFTQATDTLEQFFSAKQEHGESLTDHVKQFEQARDNVESVLGEKFLHRFIETVDACKNTCENEEKEAVLKGSWDCWTPHMQLRNSKKINVDRSRII